MDKTMKGACIDEITHLICDADKKVNITDVSNNWNISLRDSETVLLEWIEKNKKQPLNKEFLIRGVDNSGKCVITVLPEVKLDFVQKKFEKFCYSLYSVELASKSNAKRINVAKISDCKWINLPAKHVERDIEAKPHPDQTIKQVEEPATSKKGIKSMFSVSETAKKSEIKLETGKKAEVKEEPEVVDVKTEKETPKKQSPKKKEPNKTPKMASGKSSISSFFSKSSAQPKKEELSKPAKNEDSWNMFDDQFSMEVNEISTPTDDGNQVTKQESKEKKPTTAQNNKKRSIDDVDDGNSDEIPGTPREIIKVRKINKKTSDKSKRSRIVKMDDSSDDEDNRDEQLKLLASPVKEKENKTPPKEESATAKGKRRKARKTVTSTYKDEEGYLVTKNEIVEYSCSDEDAQQEIQAFPAKPLPTAEDVQAAEVSEKTTKKKKPSPPSKQGSILSFFSKK